MADPIYGLNKTGIARTAETNRRVLGRLPDSGRRTRRVYPPGGGGGVDQITFFISSLDPLKGTLDSRPCDQATVADEYAGEVPLVNRAPEGCLTIEIGTWGVASRLKGVEQDAECSWVIVNLCCN